MQDVISTQEPAVNKSERGWEESQTWGFLMKSVTKESKLYTDILHDDQRNRYMRKMTKLRES